jgi:NAD(P)-dependent dehydrogenase (short-subunit alcohol dehydrogenase family)
VKEPKEDGLMKHDPRPSLVAVHRETMAQWLELQREQVRLNERFLRLQERLVAAELGLPEPATEAAPEELRDRPVAAPVQGGTGLRVAPAPVLPRLEPTGAPAPVAGESAPPATEPTAAAPPEEVPATAPAAAAAEPEGDGPPPVETFYRDLLAEVSQRTGYPEEMLDPELPLESGLGIDSIKVMEIFSALKPYHHVLSGPDQDEEDVLARFVELKTLGAIREHYAQRRATVLRGGTAPAVQAPAADESDAESVAGSPTTDAPPDAPSSDGRVDRLVVRAVRSEPLGEVSIDAEALRFSKEHVLLLVGEVPEYGPGLRAALAGGGYPAFQVIPGKELRRLGERRYEVDLDDPASVAGLPDAIEKECGARVGGMVSFLGLGDGFREPDLAAIDAPLQLAIRLLNLSKIFEEDVLASVEAGGGLLVNLTSLDGHFGLSDSRPLPVAQAASLGFFKALSKEWRDVRVKNIDVDPDADPQALLTALVAEIACWDDRLEVGIDAQGRWSVDLVEEATAPPGPPGDGATVDPAAGARELEAWTRELELDPESVVLATGGARGITAEVLRVLARETRTRLVIVGRSALTSAEDERAEVRELQDPEELRQALIRVLGSNGGATPAQIESELRAVLRDRAIRANLADFAEAGSAVEYHALDVRDPDALAALVHDVYERFGRIDGVVHGAGVVEDRRLKDKTPESFAHVFQTKVRPAMVLAQALRPESLKFLAFFSSLSGRVGNAGQLD